MSRRTARSSIRMALRPSGYLPSAPLHAPRSGRSSPFPTFATNARHWPPTWFNLIVRWGKDLGSPHRKRLINRSLHKISLHRILSARTLEFGAIKADPDGPLCPVTHSDFERLTILGPDSPSSGKPQ